VTYVSKGLSEMLKTHYSCQRLYYLLRIGKLRGEKKGGQWVIRKEDANALYFKYIREDEKQMRFA